MTAVVDPVAAHVAELDHVLRGPGSVKRCMIAELRNGLHDAATAYRENGHDPQRAAALAVQDFGEVREVAPQLQEELTARQGRSTALLIAVAFPAMLVAWDLLWQTGHGWSGPLPAAVPVLARVLDSATVVIAAVALALLLTTFRRRAAPGLVTGLAGLVAAAGVLVCNGIAVLMNLAKPQHAVTMLTTQPAAMAVAAASAVASVLLWRSAARALRAAHAHRTRSDQ